MDIEEYRNFCMNLKGSTESFPFDSETLVFKVGNKMYALANIENFSSINLKCDPEIAEQLREEFPEVLPGYHMNKKHWNTIRVDGSLSNEQLKKWILDSYNLIFNSLTKKSQLEISPLD